MTKEKDKPTRILSPITVYLTEKDVRKRMDMEFVHTLNGLAQMLEAWGDLECKGGGSPDPGEALFHCRACICNGIKNHVNQAIAYVKGAE